MKKVLLTFLILLTMGFVVHAEDQQYSYTFSGTTFTGSDQTKTLNGVDWILTTNTGYIATEADNGLHLGSGKKTLQDVNLTTYGFEDYVITGVKVECKDASTTAPATLSVKVGEETLGLPCVINSTVTEYSFEGNLSGSKLSINFNRSSSQTKAIYIKTITVIYTSGGGGDEPDPTPDKTTITLAFDPTSGEINLANEDKTLDLTNYLTAKDADGNDVPEAKAAVVYTSGNTSFATVENGVVTGVARGTTKITASIPSTNETYSATDVTFDLTVNDPNYKPDVYELVTDSEDIIAGGKYVLIGKNDNEYYGMAGQSGNFRSIVVVTVNGNEFTFNEGSKVTPFTLEAFDDSNFYIKLDDKYLNNNKNSTYVTEGNSGSTNYEFTLKNDNTVSIKSSAGTTSTRLLRFNYADNRIGCYAQSGTTYFDGYLYKLQSGPKAAKLQYGITEHTMRVGDTPFTAPLTYATNAPITYSSSDNTIATVDESGAVTPLAEGQVTITATAAANDEYRAGSDSYTLTVIPADVRTTVVLRFVNEDGEAITAGDLDINTSISLPLNFTGADGAVLDDETIAAVKAVLIYEIKENGATFISIDENGDIRGIKRGTAKVKVSIPDIEGGQFKPTSAEYTVTVVDHRVHVTLAFNPSEGAVNKNKTLTLPLSVTSPDGIDETEVKGVVEYKISDESVASEVGGVVKGLKWGKVTITASIPDDNELYTAEPVTFTLKVNDTSLDVYNLVTSQDDILNKGQYVFISNNNGVYRGMAGLAGENSTQYRVTEELYDYAFSGNSFESYNANIVPITLEDAGNGEFYIITSKGYFQNNSGVYIKSISDKTQATKFKFTLGSDNKVSIINDTNNNRGLRFRISNNRVACYTPGSDYVNGYLYKLPDSGVYPPVITSEGKTVTITCDDQDNSIISYTTDGTDPSENREAEVYDTPFDVKQRVTVVKAVRMDENGDLSAVVTKEVTYVKDSYDNLAELFGPEYSAAGDEVTLNFPLTVIYQHGDYLYAKDANDYVLIYGTTAKTDYKNGDVIAAGSEVTVSTLNGAFCLTPRTLGSVSEGSPVEPVVSEYIILNETDLAHYYSFTHTHVEIEGNSGTISNGDEIVELVDLFGLNLSSNDNQTVTGFVGLNNGTLQFYPISMEKSPIENFPEEVTVNAEPNDEGIYEVLIGTKLTFEADYAEGYVVKIGAGEQQNIERAQYLYTAYNTEGDVIEITPYNELGNGEMKSFTVKAIIGTPVFSIDNGSNGEEYNKVSNNTEVTITCKNAASIKYAIYYTDEADLNPNDYISVDNKNSVTLTISQKCKIFALGIYGDGSESNPAVAKYKIEYPLTSLINFIGDAVSDLYGMTRLSGNTNEYNPKGTSFEIEGRIFELNSANVKDSQTRLWKDGLRFYSGSYMTVTAPLGYQIADIRLYKTYKTASDNTPASSLEWNINHGKASCNISCTLEKGNTPLGYMVVEIVEVEAPNWNEFNPELRHDDHEGYVIRKGAKVDGVQMYDVWMKLPKDCHLYYSHSAGSVEPVAYAPRRAVDHTGYTMADTPKEDLEDVHTFSVPAGTVEYYAYHPATDSASKPATFAVNDDNLTTGIEGVEVDSAEEAVYYNLQGIRVVNPGAGVYIKIVDGKAVKVVL